MKIQELSDGRFIGHNILEIEAFPAMESFNVGELEAVTKTADLFRQVVQEFHKLGRDGNSCAEMLWITERADKQAFRSRIRVFLVLRRIEANRDNLLIELESIQKNFATLLISRRFGVSVLQDESNELVNLLTQVDKSCTYSIVKAEKCVGNAGSLYPYYFCDVLPGNNTDNFNSFAASLCQYENCCVSFQLFPTSLTANEAYYINEQASYLARIAGGIVMERQIIRDEAATAPQKVMNYYAQRSNSPLFQYNILVFGQRTTCAALATKVISLLQAGKDVVGPYDCGCIDLTKEKIDLERQFVFYPWNVNTKLLRAYRNLKLIQTLQSASVLYRLPYILSVEEATAFFRLPIREKNMAALRSNQTMDAGEQFSSAVTDERSIKLGMLYGKHDVQIGCPEKSFTKHALVVGTPGSGKTTFSVNLLLQFYNRGIPFLAIEPTKTEYRAMIDAIPDIQIFTPGNNAVSPFIINPFLPPKGIRIEQYIPSLASAFEAAFAMPSPLDILFLRAIRMCYTEHGWKDYSQQGDADVSVFGMHEFIMCFKKIVSTSNYSREVKGNIESGGVFRLMNLIEQNRNIYDTVHTVPIEDILRCPTVLELNAIDNSEQKALIMALLLINICLYTKHNQLGDGKLKNAILIDEAHVLLAGGGKARTDAADAQQSTVKALQDMIAEIRSYGTSIIIADQSPTKVSREIVANTDIKVSFRLVQNSEKELIADSINMDSAAMQQLSRLKPGEAYVYYSLLEVPQLVVTDDIREEQGIRLAVPNEEIAARMHYWDTRKKMLRPYYACAACGNCKEGCDFRIRAQADYYTERLYEKSVSAVRDKDTLIRYLCSMDRLLANVSQSYSEESKARLANCCRIKFSRKIALERSIGLTRKELIHVIHSCSEKIVDSTE